MQLISNTSSTITTNTFTFDIDGRKVVYIEYLNEKNKVTDCNLRDENGNEIDDAALLEELQNFVDSMPPKKIN